MTDTATTTILYHSYFERWVQIVNRRILRPHVRVTLNTTHTVKSGRIISGPIHRSTRPKWEVRFDDGTVEYANGDQLR